MDWEDPRAVWMSEYILATTKSKADKWKKRFRTLEADRRSFVQRWRQATSEARDAELSGSTLPGGGGGTPPLPHTIPGSDDPIKTCLDSFMNAMACI